MQNLALALEGPAIDCLRKVKEDEIGAYDKLWSILANRFGYLDEAERAMRRFDNRKQLDSESVAEYEQALRTLYTEAWPRAEESTKDAALKQKFEEGLHSEEMLQFLKLHARFDDFGQTVAKARRFAEIQEAVNSKKSVRIIENRDVDHNATDQSVVKQLLEGFEKILKNVIQDRPQVAFVVKETGSTQQGRAPTPAPNKRNNQSQPVTQPRRNSNSWNQRPNQPNQDSGNLQRQFQRPDTNRGPPPQPPRNPEYYNREQDRKSDRSFRSFRSNRYT